MRSPDDYDPDFPDESEAQSVGVAVLILIACVLGFAALLLA